MRLSLLALALALALATMLALCSVAHAMSWEEGSYETALSRARASGRFVLLEISASWCGPCHDLDEQVWPREEVQRALQPAFVALRRDGEQGDGVDLAKRFHVVGFPTLLVIDPGPGDRGHVSGANKAEEVPSRGEAPGPAPDVEIDRVMGFLPAREMVQTLLQLRGGKRGLAELEQRLKSAPESEAASLKLEIATRHAWRGDARAVEELNAIVAGDSANEGKRAATALLTLGKYYYLRGAKDYVHAEATLRELGSRFPSSQQAGEVPYNLGIALHHLGRDADARRVLDDWLAAGSTDVARYNAVAWLCFKNGFDGPRAIDVAKRGLAVDAKEHGLWDTLAELYAQAGKLDSARDAEQTALKLKPGDAYYRAQLRKFGGAP
jgi:tetratricopeptide (TPR) repeat protein